MYVEFYGAAGEVTGSLHRVQVGDITIALDCGLVQGRRERSNQLNRNLPKWAIEADVLVLSHAHIDHSGNIPRLVKSGFQGNIYCTPATRDLCSVMLRDSAIIQKQDARYLNRHREAGRPPIEPLYEVEDAHNAVKQMISVPLHRSIPIAPGVTLQFFDSGHVLGSALVVLDLEYQGTRRRLLFTGDLGREELPLLRSPEVVENVDALIMESTYGDREHPDISRLDDDLAKIIEDTLERKGRVLIPTFALERAQEVLFALSRLQKSGRLPDVPIYIDSPLAISITEIYKLHPESLDPEIRDLLLARQGPFSPPNLRYISAVEDSKELQNSTQPCIIIAGAGMCEGGRILFHFVRGLGNADNSVVIVGFMAQHTLGRRIVERRDEVRVLGVMRELRAQVHVVEGLSAHADKNDLLDFAVDTAAAGNLRKLVLVHGEVEAQEALTASIEEKMSIKVVRAAKGETLKL
jgi:metallo-beta-lactamase family protein